MKKVRCCYADSPVKLEKEIESFLNQHLISSNFPVMIQYAPIPGYAHATPRFTALVVIEIYEEVK